MILPNCGRGAALPVLNWRRHLFCYTALDFPAGRMANAIEERWLLGHTAGRYESQGSSSPTGAHLAQSHNRGG